MEKRIVRLEEGSWRIRTGIGELPKSEQIEVIEYFDEIKLPYRLIDGCLCIVGDVDRESVFERLEHFYDGRAEIFPF